MTPHTRMPICAYACCTLKLRASASQLRARTPAAHAALVRSLTQSSLTSVSDLRYGSSCGATRSSWARSADLMILSTWCWRTSPNSAVCTRPLSYDHAPAQQMPATRLSSIFGPRTEHPTSAACQRLLGHESVLCSWKDQPLPSSVAAFHRSFLLAARLPLRGSGSPSWSRFSLMETTWLWYAPRC
eukprot:6200539-Pleurochrysis_carterae.AAC.2